MTRPSLLLAILVTQFIAVGAIGQTIGKKAKKDPPEAQATVGTGDPELDRLVTQTKDRSAKVRLQAVQEIGRRGLAAGKAAPALCDATLDPVPQVVAAAMDAIERTRPEIFRPMQRLILDKNQDLWVQALNDLSRLGGNGAPTTNVLVAALRKEMSKRRTSPGLTHLETTLFNTLESVSPENPTVGVMLRELAGPTNTDSGSRLFAIARMAERAGEVEARRKEVMPYLRLGLTDRVCQLECVKIAGTYGRLAKDLLPLLKMLKLSSNEAIRDAATEAVLKIEQ